MSVAAHVIHRPYNCTRRGIEPSIGAYGAVEGWQCSFHFVFPDAWLDINLPSHSSAYLQMIVIPIYVSARLHRSEKTIYRQKI